MASLEHLKVGGRRYAAKKTAANPPSKKLKDEENIISPESIKTPSVGKADGAQSVLNNMKPATASTTVNNALPNGTPAVEVGTTKPLWTQENNSRPLVDTISDGMVTADTAIRGAGQAAGDQIASGLTSVATAMPKTWQSPQPAFKAGPLAVPSGPTPSMPDLSGAKDWPSRTLSPEAIKAGFNKSFELNPTQQRFMDVAKQPATTIETPITAAATSPTTAPAAPLQTTMKSTGKPGEVTPLDLNAAQKTPIYTNADLENLPGPTIKAGGTEIFSPGGRALSAEETTNIQKVMNGEGSSEVFPRQNSETAAQTSPIAASARTESTAAARESVPGTKPRQRKSGGLVAGPDMTKPGYFTPIPIKSSERPPGSIVDTGGTSRDAEDLRTNMKAQMDSDAYRLKELSRDLKNYRAGDKTSFRAMLGEYNDLRQSLTSSQNVLAGIDATADERSANAEQSRSLAEKYRRPDLQVVPEGSSLWETRPGQSTATPVWGGAPKTSGKTSPGFDSLSKEMQFSFNQDQKNGVFGDSGEAEDWPAYEARNLARFAEKYPKRFSLDKKASKDYDIVTDLRTGDIKQIPKGL